MPLYVSNPSKQPCVFYYRTAKTNDSSGPYAIDIPAGGQVELNTLNWTRDQLDYVIQQILRTGGADAAEAHGKMGKFTGLLYREGRAPVSEEEIVTAHDAVIKHAEDRSVQQATRGALAADRTMNQMKKGRQRLTRETSVEVIEDVGPHTRRTGNEASFKLTIDAEEGRTDVRLPV